jgi:hypothetical protein
MGGLLGLGAFGFGFVGGFLGGLFGFSYGFWGLAGLDWVAFGASLGVFWGLLLYWVLFCGLARPFLCILPVYLKALYAF